MFLSYRQIFVHSPFLAMDFFVTILSNGWDRTFRFTFNKYIIFFFLLIIKTAPQVIFHNFENFFLVQCKQSMIIDIVYSYFP